MNTNIFLCFALILLMKNTDFGKWCFVQYSIKCFLKTVDRALVAANGVGYLEEAGRVNTYFTLYDNVAWTKAVG
jgi:hypothetical protein